VIILGDRYTFTELEMDRLKRTFPHIRHISYSGLQNENVLETIRQAIRQDGARLIVLNTSAVLPEETLQFLINQEEKGITYIDIETFLETYLNKVFVPAPGEKHDTACDPFPYSPVQYLQKRVIDILGVLGIGILFSPIMLYIALRIRKESPGPIFFRQTRVGLRGEEFECVKFRSMHLDAEKDGAQFAQENDPRTFDFGQKIRRARLDELPQIWNVIKGEMHIVGPRPERPIWVREFEKSIPNYQKRHVVAPGITGWAQIMYHYGRGEVDAHQKLMYDLYYIKNWSLRFEFKVIWRTIKYFLGAH
jgi:exopolysaccharide biosynthesis polyprenyl glycosylphosphotransferase